jgi:hypothetical protein
MGFGPAVACYDAIQAIYLGASCGKLRISSQLCAIPVVK